MKISLGNSKLAKQFAWLFIFCAFLPTLILIFVSYSQVSSQMIDQNVQRLVKDTKTYGLSLFNRLVRVSDQLLFLAQILKTDGIQSSKIKSIIRPELLEIFDGIAVLRNDDQTVNLLGEIDIPDSTTIDKQSSEKSTAGTILSINSVGEPAHIYIMYPFTTPQEGMMLLIGKVNISYLWGIGAVPLLPPSTELAVYNKDNEILISTYSSAGKQMQKMTLVSTSKNLFNFEYSHENKKYHAGMWSLFLQSRFDAGSWKIVLSQPEGYILSSLKDFRTHLLQVIMIGLLIILLVSTRLIRKRLLPLDLLKVRTQQIAQKDFTSEVHIKSNDEFEDLAKSFNIMSRQLNRQFNALETIDKIDRTILSSLNVQEIINATLSMIQDFFSSDSIALCRIIGSTSHQLRSYVLKKGLQTPEIQYIPLTEQNHAHIFTSTDVTVWQKDQIPFKGLFPQQPDPYKCFLSIPLLKGNSRQGVLILAHNVNRNYDDDELQQLRQFADQVSIALSNSELVENLEKLATGTIEALARTVDAKSKWTSGHSERVAIIAGQIGRALNLNFAELDVLDRAGLLHDIGKIGIPVAILDKPAKLTDKEFAEIKNHPEIGVKILEPIEAYQDILPAILQHHERFDGNGYPQGLAGKEIALNGRILAVADVYDALSSSRPYRDGWVKDKALAYIVDNAGTLFDPNVVKALKATIV